MRLPLLAVLFVGAFGVLLSSFPNRNSDVRVWGYLAGGRAVTERLGELSPTWLYDLAAYVLYSIFGGTGLVCVKALLCGVVAVLILVMSSRRGEGFPPAGYWRVPLAVTVLAVLALGSRLLLHPATISVFFLTLSLWWLLRGEARSSDGRFQWWPGWRLVALFAVWGNVDERVVLGLLVVALVWFGQLMDSPAPGGFWRGLASRGAGLAVLIAVACASPVHVNNLRLPPELRSALDALRPEASGSSATVNSPFTRAYLSDFRESPAALAYFPLLVLGLFSFLLNRKGWRWAWLLPWLALGIVSGIQVRLVPFFAVLAGPVTSWNLVEFFVNRGAPAPARPRVRYALGALTGILALAFLVAAWPGWLQGPPFEPRRWVVEPPVAIQHGAAFLRQALASGLWPPESRTLYPTAETAAAFTWFCAEDRGLRDESVVAQLLKPDEVEPTRERLRALGVTRIVVSAADRGDAAQQLLSRLLADPDEWPVLHLSGGVVVFGWRDPARTPEVNPYEGWEVDFTRLAFRPDASEIAPPTRGVSERRWWDAFWKPAPARSAARDEALVLLKKSEVMIGSAPLRHQAIWEAGQMSSLIGAASGWIAPAGPADAALRLALVRPPIPDNAPNVPLPPITQVVFGLQKRFTFNCGLTPVGTMYASLRASWRAVAENPNDAYTYFILGQTYAALVRTTSEQSWVARLPALMRLRQLQASAALNRAVALNPNLPEAQLELGRLYLALKCPDLAAVHFRAYRDTPARLGGPKKGDRQAEQVLAQLDRLTEALNVQTREFAKESPRASVRDRAEMALQRGLAGEALKLLLSSDFSAFGKAGMELELDLLLRTGRPEDVLAWLTMTPEARDSLGDSTYSWYRAQANIALGEYAAADDEFRAIADSEGQGREQVGGEVGAMVGKALLDQQPGGLSTPQFVMRTFTEADFNTRMNQIEQRLSRLNDAQVLRGLIALEAGNIDRARESFRAALAYSPQRWGAGQLEFNGRWVAWECLGLIDSVEARPARPRTP